MSEYSKGIYLGEIVDCGFDEVGENNTPCLKIQFKVQAKKVGNEYEEVPNQYLRDVTAWLSDKAAELTIKKLKENTQWKGDDLMEWDGDHMVGKQIRVVCSGQNEQGYDLFDFPFEHGAGKQINKKKGLSAKLSKRLSKYMPKAKQTKTVEVPDDFDKEKVPL